MSSRIQFYSILGSNPFEPRCFVLKVDEFKLLLDCGWNSKFDVSDIEALHSVDLSSIDAVLLSQPDLFHLGALPYAYAKLGLKAPIFATAPIWRMGQYMLMDAFVAIHQSHANFDLFSHDDIKKVFKTKFKSKLKYSQEYPLIKEIKTEGKYDYESNNNNKKTEEKKQEEKKEENELIKRIGNSNTVIGSNNIDINNGTNTISLIITPYAAGHMVGGTIWKITFETDNIIYAIDYNIRREKHLNESVFGILEIRPTLLITDCINIGHEFIVKRKQRETQLYNLCINTLKNGGNVLIPSDASGRCLEILYSLYSSFNKHKDFNKYHLVFLSYTSKNTLNSAKSMLEWMCDSCQRELNKSQKNVFEFKELLICQTMNEFKSCIKFPYVCIATNEILESGLSQQLFVQLSKHTSNLILLTQRCNNNTLNGKLYDIIIGNMGKDRNIEFEYFYKEKLNDEEKIKYVLKQKQKETLAIEKEKKERENAIAFDIDATDDNNKLKKHTDDDIKMITNDTDDDDNDNDNENDNENDNDNDDDILIYDRELNKQIKMTSNYDMYPYNEYDDICMTMTDYGLKVDLNQWKQNSNNNSGKKRKRESFGDSDGYLDEYELYDQYTSKSNSLSPSPNDIVNQTMSLLPSNVLNPDPLQPYKTVKQIKKLFIKCQLKFLNIEGRSDYESIKQTLPTLQPRQIILVHGSEIQKNKFKQFCIEENISNKNEIFNAQNNKWINIKTNTKYKKIIMDDMIERYLEFYNINGYDVAYLNGILKQIDNINEMNIDIGDIKDKNIIKDIKYKLSKYEKKNLKQQDDININHNNIDINKININYPSNDGHSLTYLGDVTKIEMETNLKQNNIPAELYYGGTLVAGKSGEVRVTHKNAQKTVLAVDATLTGDYFGIRDTISNQYHLI